MLVQRKNNQNRANGEEHAIAEWSRLTGINAKTLYAKSEKGLNIDFEKEIEKKIKINEGRPYKHGKQF